MTMKRGIGGLFHVQAIRYYDDIDGKPFFLDDDSRFVMTLNVCFNALQSFLLKKAGTLHSDIMDQMVLGN